MSDQFPICEVGLPSFSLVSAGLASLLLLVGSVVAGVPGPANIVALGKEATPPRMLGRRAVMHVYSYVLTTLEITSVTSHFFKDVDACERAMENALRTAASHASEGDLVDAQCVAVDPREAVAQPESTPRSAAVTNL